MSSASEAPAGREEYETPKDFAALLKISRRQVYRLMEDPTFPVLVIGKLRRIPKGRATRWLAQREQGRGRPRLVAAVKEGPAA